MRERASRLRSVDAVIVNGGTAQAGEIPMQLQPGLAVNLLTGERRDGRVGIWVVDPVTGAEDKIAALGIRIRRGVSFHGVSLNVDPDLAHFAGIVPCGISQHGVTSLSRLGKKAAQTEIDAALRAAFAEVFGG